VCVCVCVCVCVWRQRETSAGGVKLLCIVSYLQNTKCSGQTGKQVLDIRSVILPVHRSQDHIAPNNTDLDQLINGKQNEISRNANNGCMNKPSQQWNNSIAHYTYGKDLQTTDLP